MCSESLPSSRYRVPEIRQPGSPSKLFATHSVCSTASLKDGLRDEVDAVLPCTCARMSFSLRLILVYGLNEQRSYPSHSEAGSIRGYLGWETTE